MFVFLANECSGRILTLTESFSLVIVSRGRDSESPQHWVVISRDEGKPHIPMVECESKDSGKRIIDSVQVDIRKSLHSGRIIDSVIIDMDKIVQHEKEAFQKGKSNGPDKE